MNCAETINERRLDEVPVELRPKASQLERSTASHAAAIVEAA